MQACKSSADCQATEARFRDRGVNHSLRTEAVKKTFCDFVGAIVLRDFFSEYEDLVVRFQLFGESFVESVSNGDLSPSFTSVASYRWDRTWRYPAE